MMRKAQTKPTVPNTIPDKREAFHAAVELMDGNNI
jgi:hypothetical protein